MEVLKDKTSAMHGKRWPSGRGLGTTGAKAALLSADGRLRGEAGCAPEQLPPAG